MNLENIKSFPGSERPSDLFEPFMPGVDLLSDMDALFTTARSQIALGCPSGEPPLPEDSRGIAIVTPGRMIMCVAGLIPGSKSPKELKPIREILPSDGPLNISVVSYTFLDGWSFTKDADDHLSV